MGAKLPSRDLIEKILLYFPIKEIPSYFKVSSHFNINVNWKTLVRRDFGVTRRYCDTWKDTAILLVQCNMINLNKKWIDGRTYRELYFDSILTSTFFIDIQKEHSIKDFFVKESITNLDEFMTYTENLNDPLFTYGFYHEAIRDDGKYIKKHLRFMTREYNVIHHAQRQYMHSLNRTPPIAYILCYSVIPYNRLRNMKTWEYFDLNIEVNNRRRTAFFSRSFERIMLTRSDRWEKDNDKRKKVRIEYDIYPTICHDKNVYGSYKLINPIKELRINVKEDMYRKIVKNNYGIDIMYGDTWKDTSHFFHCVDMINLNKRWIDGRTYREILDVGEICKESGYVFPDHVTDIASARKFVKYAYAYECDNDIYKYFASVYNVKISSGEKAFKDHLRRVTREYVIICLTIRDMKNDLKKVNYGGNQKILNKIKAIFTDSITIITNYTLMPIDDLPDLFHCG